MNQSTNQSIIQPTNQPINQPTNQSINQSINQSTNQSTDQPTNQSINQSLAQSRTWKCLWMLCPCRSGRGFRWSTTMMTTNSSTWSEFTPASRCRPAPSPKCSSGWTARKAKLDSVSSMTVNDRCAASQSQCQCQCHCVDLYSASPAKGAGP